MPSAIAGSPISTSSAISSRSPKTPDSAQKWREVKRANKRELASFIEKRTGVPVDPDSMFDVQVKRIHEYKRQHLNILHVIALVSPHEGGPFV